MNNLFWKSIKSFLYRSSDLLYKIFPAKFVLKLYCYLTHVFNTVTWRIASKYYGPEIVKHRGGVSEFILSQINNGDNVLDIGCADAYLTRIIAKKARNVLGVDVDSRYINNLDKDARNLENVKFIISDVLDLDLKETFDVAILIHTIEHIEKSGRAFKKLSFLAHKIVVETPDEDNWISKILADFGMKILDDDKHVKLYSDISLKKELEENNWRDVVTYKSFGHIRAIGRSKNFK